MCSRARMGCTVWAVMPGRRNPSGVHFETVGFWGCWRPESMSSPQMRAGRYPCRSMTHRYPCRSSPSPGFVCRCGQATFNACLRTWPLCVTSMPLCLRVVQFARVVSTSPLHLDCRLPRRMSRCRWPHRAAVQPCIHPSSTPALRRVRLPGSFFINSIAATNSPTAA